MKAIEDIELVHCKYNIHAPTVLKQVIMEWYHKILVVHPGTSRLEATLRQSAGDLTYKRMLSTFANTVMCVSSQRNRKRNIINYLPRKQRKSFGIRSKLIYGDLLPRTSRRMAN